MRSLTNFKKIPCNSSSEALKELSHEIEGGEKWYQSNHTDRPRGRQISGCILKRQISKEA